MKITIASCAKVQDRSAQPAWDEIRACRPNALLVLGDKVYLDRDDHVDAQALVAELRTLYQRQFAQPSVLRCRQTCEHAGAARRAPQRVGRIRQCCVHAGAACSRSTTPMIFSVTSAAAAMRRPGFVRLQGPSSCVRLPHPHHPHHPHHPAPTPAPRAMACVTSVWSICCCWTCVGPALTPPRKRFDGRRRAARARPMPLAGVGNGSQHGAPFCCWPAAPRFNVSRRKAGSSRPGPSSACGRCWRRAAAHSSSAATCTAMPSTTTAA